MRKNKIYFGMLFLVLVSVTIWSAYEMLNVGRKGDPYAVSVIVNDSNNDRWLAMREGLEQAANGNNIDLNYVFSGKFASVQEELELIKREVKNGADGLIVQMVADGANSKELEQMVGQTEIVLLESDTQPEGIYAWTGPDNIGLGKTLGEIILQDIGGEKIKKKIGIVCGNKKQLSVQQRLIGVEEALADTKADVLWSVSGDLEQMSKALSEKDLVRPVEVLIALGNDETELAVDYLLAKESEGIKRCLLYGIGCSEKAVYYLDQGRISSLVVPNEFNMGYLSIEQMARQLDSPLSEAKGQVINYLVVDRTNLYMEENQKILFPIVQ